jgi:hypothetical protein
MMDKILFLKRKNKAIKRDPNPRNTTSRTISNTKYLDKKQKNIEKSL